MRSNFLRDMLEKTIASIVCVLAVFAAVWAGLIVRKLYRLHQKFASAIVLIPLFYRKKWSIVATVFLSILLLVDLILMATVGYYIICAGVAVLLLSLIVVMGAMISVRCAVLDGGIVVPFRFIDWTHLYDYRIDGNTVFFIGDKNGHDIMRSSSPVLYFDRSSAEKLEYVLSRHRLK